ncbi:hypothetical protein EZV62_006370 [Acer yangbiense]|uniref:TF-B3 domain-containing protein n=1 Tax=Acer yangbiense TaxID=1000413 RepID=A0A5C7I7G0_9ROSI|nr:hypothetical protein EZV62_006370 [Acer yangbiense]
MFQPPFTVSKLLTENDITTKPALPAKILQHIRLPQGEHFAELQVTDSREQVWIFRYYTRPGGNRANPVFTSGWKQFARAKRLEADDKLTIYGRQDGELQIQGGKSPKVSYNSNTIVLFVLISGRVGLAQGLLVSNS